MTENRGRFEFPIRKGEIVFRQGDTGDEMFVIERGKIRLTLEAEGYEKEVAILGEGQFFGELSLIGNAPRSATAQAIEDSMLLAIGRDVFNMMVQDDLSIVFRMMAIQGQRLSRTNEPIEQLTLRLGEVRIIAHILRDTSAQQFPLNVDAARLADNLGMARAVVDMTLGDLARRGVGKLSDGRLSIGDAAQRERLLDVIYEHATQ